ncbi:MAG: leucyl/phenylalanyl-tRNA--protein transferase [Gammaproteobacteria bacterium]|nr:MAG: leucyl/phenylalanyl-tRNA--protein transferase [Gammaproteobacteria bacterium]
MKSPRITWISSEDPPEAFPDVASAFDSPDGLLAAGGDLSEERLLYAYRHGIFPWFDEGQPILWWSPDPRCVIRPGEFHISRRLRRYLRQSGFKISFNTAFNEVIAKCAEDRDGQQGTWITTGMTDAYSILHRNGWAHSVEVWSEGDLCGGLYGLAIGKAFFGESMFSRHSNASKAAMTALCQLLSEAGFAVLDCQVESPHLLGLGARLIPRTEFATMLSAACEPQSQLLTFPAGRVKITDFNC